MNAEVFPRVMRRVSEWLSFDRIVYLNEEWYAARNGSDGFVVFRAKGQNRAEEKVARLCPMKWHPYPAEKPSEEVKEYIVSAVLPNGDRFSICSEWQGSEEKGWGGCHHLNVVAWTELPNPYVGGCE